MTPSLEVVLRTLLGIVALSAMTTLVLTLAKVPRRFASALAILRGTLQLTLGATPRVATLRIARHGLREAMVPTTDQTRTTGLVTLPGTFVGAIFGGISPLEAGRFQIVVLAALMATAAVTAAVIDFGLAPGTRRGDGAALR